MQLDEIKEKIPQALYNSLLARIEKFRPVQEKAINSGLLEGKNVLACTPTASGKTLVAELGGIKRILESKGKMIYIVPLKALASEKYKDFKKRYSMIKIGMSVGDLDSKDPYLAENNLIVCTAEKLDSLMRHKAEWLMGVGTVVIDEIHLLNDSGRGPTLEILITMLRELLPKVQIIGLSATIGNPYELAEWLKAELIIDEWRPVKLQKGIYYEGKILLN